ncbi:MAG: DUF4412 domain-containing protein [Ignavibacteriae bacterium]|nr:DUF4412 domain-containing protein [Ignavibacteriota bacterium]
MKLKFITLLILAALSLNAQGLCWETTESGMGRERSSQTFYLPKMLKTVSAECTVIYRLDKSLMYIVNPIDETYSENNFAELEEAAKKMGAWVDEKMEEQRQLFGATDSSAEVEWQVTNTGQKKTVSGYQCTKFVVTEGATEMGTVWVTSELEEFSALHKDLVQISSLTAKAHLAQPILAARKQIDGFPMLIETALGKIRVKHHVTKLEKRFIAESEFEAPEGYTKVPSSINYQQAPKVTGQKSVTIPPKDTTLQQR